MGFRSQFKTLSFTSGPEVVLSQKFPLYTIIFFKEISQSFHFEALQDDSSKSWEKIQQR